MSEYNDGQYRDPSHNSLYPDSPLVRQSGGYPIRRTPRYSRTTGSNPSWVSNGMLSPPTFGGRPTSAASRPPPVPSPAPSRVVSDFQPSYPAPSELGPEPEPETYPGPPMSEQRDDRDWEPEENMTIGQSMNEDEYSYGGYPPPQEQVIPKTEGIPYVYPIAPQEPEIVPETKPKGRAKNFVGGFVSGLRKLPKAVVTSHFYDRKATRKGAPGTEHETGQSYFLPSYDDPGTTVPHPESLHIVQGVEMPIPAKPPTELSYGDPTGQSSRQRVSQPRTSHRSSSQAQGSVIASSAHPRSPEAEVADPLPTSDYRKMDRPIRFPPPDDSFSAHVTRVHNFFQELKSLPWTSERVAEDYIPAKSSRAHVGKAKPSGSWYSINKHQDLDLLATTPISARAAAIRLPRSEDGATSASMRSVSRMQPGGRTPASYMTSPALFPSPGASSHGQGQHPMSLSYYFAPPQPLYVYPSPMTSPMTHDLSDLSPQTMSPEVRQAVPVYMMAGPPPGLMPSPPPAVHAVHHNQANRAASPPANVPSTRHSRHSRHSGSNVH